MTADAVIARNLVREIEVFLPLAFMGFSGAEGTISGLATFMGFAWTLLLSLFLLFNKDRMRMGDLIAGTWVVNANRTRLATSLVANTAADGIRFTPQEIGVYGIYELQELERILRSNDAKILTGVADTIRAKINRWDGVDDATFLNAYYGQLKNRLERDVLFGKRRENKFQDASGRDIAPVSD